MATLFRFQNKRHVFVFHVPIADDLAQETWLRVFKGLKGFRGDSKFSTWLTRIAWNVVKDQLARKEHLDTQFGLCDLQGDWHSPDADLLNRELDEQIQAALLDLSPKFRAAIVLTCLQDFSPEEAAELEGCTASTLYWRVYEARRQLSSRLSQYLNPP